MAPTENGELPFVKAASMYAFDERDQNLLHFINIQLKMGGFHYATRILINAQRLMRNLGSLCKHTVWNNTVCKNTL